MRKKKTVLYTEFDGSENIDQTIALDWKDIRPGQRLILGNPSNLYYQYIYPSLVFKEHKVDNLKELLDYKGMEVVVISVLKMTDGCFYAVLQRTEKKFSDQTTRIYAELKSSFVEKELIE